MNIESNPVGICTKRENNKTKRFQNNKRQSEKRQNDTATKCQNDKKVKRLAKEKNDNCVILQFY